MLIALFVQPWCEPEGVVCMQGYAICYKYLNPLGSVVRSNPTNIQLGAPLHTSVKSNMLRGDIKRDFAYH